MIQKSRPKGLYPLNGLLINVPIDHIPTTNTVITSVGDNGSSGSSSSGSSSDIHITTFKDIILTSDQSKGTISHRSHIFTDIYILPQYNDVSDPAKRSREIDNAGGKSDISEMFSIDYLIRCHGAYDVIFETEVQYWITYKMVDFICTINSHRVGVSVARAMAYPSPDRFTPAMASKLLYKKLYGLIVARNAVTKHQSFYRSILHIWCQDVRIADLMRDAFANLDDNDYGLDVKGIVILQLSVCPDTQLYKNKIF